MKEAFKAYPEFICLDATYKLAVYVMVCEDSNGHTKIIATCLFVSEDESSIKWMVNTFKDHNSESSSIQIIMADKDRVERNVIKQCLPNAILQFVSFIH